MALKIRLKFQPDNRAEHPRSDLYQGREGDWLIEVYVPSGEDPLEADVHFEFWGRKQSETTATGG